MKSTIYIYYLLIITLTCSCTNDHFEATKKYSAAFSMNVNNNKVLVSGYVYTDNQWKAEYWVDSTNVDAVTYTSSLANGSIYNIPVDELSRKISVYKTLNGNQDIYKFDQGSLIDDGSVFYYKNNNMIKMDTTAIGTVTSVGFFNNNPIFSGYFGEITHNEAGESLSPKTPFLWNGDSLLIHLPLPEDATFQGINCVYFDSENYYTGGLMNVPMYWKNTTPITLSNLYGEVHQIIVSESDVYAVGFYNKSNSNSTGNTACYWKNEELFELEDNAQAYGIFIDGDDVYISGATGNIPPQYKACYWKNGVRVDLPD
ncbi:hypothetical protein [Pseudalgibacter alginicilyticus]|nr:hypothetical protein [Pseudalgibacter alginicilyticus]